MAGIGWDSRLTQQKWLFLPSPPASFRRRSAEDAAAAAKCTTTGTKCTTTGTSFFRRRVILAVDDLQVAGSATAAVDSER